MAVVINAKGTSVAQFQIGKQGPIIKNNSGVIEFKDSTDTDLQVQILSTANAVNNLTLTGSATGNDATIAVVGTDTNINIKLEPKGTGEVILGPTGAASSSLQAEDDQDLFVLGGDSGGSAAAGDLVLQGGDGTGGFASGNIEIRGGTGGSGAGTVIIDSTEFALPVGGGITIGSATGGNQGSGTVNATNYFKNGVELTSPQVIFDSDTFTGDGTTVGFTLSRTPVSQDAILVAVSGLLQDGGVDFTVSGTTLTFTTAPPNAAKILVLFRDVLSTITENISAVINGNFDIWQRGTSFSSNGYTADRWRVTGGTGVTFSVARQTNTLGDGQSEFALRWDQTVAGSSASLLEQRIEGVQLFNGQTVTISVDTDLVSGAAPTVQLRIEQNFGTGGAPSASVFSAATAISIPASRTNQSVTFSVPTITGKTLGSNGDDYLAVQFVIGNAVFAMDLNECQIEAGSVATTFERRSFQQELAMAQRYYTKTFQLDVAPAQNAGRPGAIGYRTRVAGVGGQTESWRFTVRMRTAPSITFFNPGASNALWRNSSGLTDSGAASELSQSDWGLTISNAQAATDDLTELLEIHATADAEL